MQPAIIDRYTVKMTAPADRDDVATLFVREELIEGRTYLRSAWNAEQAEATLLLAGAKVLLGVAGNSHPVVHLVVADLPADFRPTVTIQRLIDADGHDIVRCESLLPSAEGARRVWAEVNVEPDGFAAAASRGLHRIEKFAKNAGMVL